MVFTLLIGVFDKQDFIDEAEQGVAELVMLVVLFQRGEVFYYLALGVEFGPELVATVTGIDKEPCAGFVGVLAEEVSQELVHDVGSGLEVYIKPEIVIVLQFVGCEWESRIEVAEQTVYGILGNLPYAEHTTHMDYAV